MRKRFCNKKNYGFVYVYIKAIEKRQTKNLFFLGDIFSIRHAFAFDPLQIGLHIHANKQLFFCKQCDFLSFEFT